MTESTPREDANAAKVADTKAPRSRLSLEALYRRHAQAATRFAYLLVGNRELAEDLVQEAFIRCASRLERLRSPEAFESYLRRTIVNLGVNAARKRGRESAAFRAHAELRGPTSTNNSPSANSDSLKEAVLSLPYQQRAALVLRFYLDLEYSECADLLGIRESSVRAAVSRGVEGVRGALVGRWEEDS
jgi:RNA polymerase sigma factor (sigma-70 family)